MTRLSPYLPRPMDWARKRIARVPVVATWVSAVVAVYLLSHGGVLRTALFPGYADQINYSVGPLRSGRVASVPVTVGQRVRQGDVVAKMSAQELDARTEQTRARLAQIQARVQAQRSMQESQVARGEIWVLRQRASARKDRAELEELGKQLARLGGLADKHLVTATQLEQTRKRYRALAARVAAYQQAVARGQAGLVDEAGEDAAATADLPHQHEDVVEARLAPFRKAVEVQEAALRELEIERAELELRAPVDGLVAALSKRPGEVVSAGTEVVNLVTARPGHVVVMAGEKMGPTISLGAQARVRRGGGGGWLDGRVVEVSPEVDELPQRARVAPVLPVWGRRVVVQVEGATGLLPGELVYVRF